MLTSIKFSLIAICVVFSTAHAAPCEENFSNSGTFLQGNTYKSHADILGVSQGSAFDGALMDISKDASWKILSSNKVTGDIQAVNASLYAKGKSVPFNVRIEAVGNGSKISVSYFTPAGMLSSEDPIKVQFCKTFAAANTGTNVPKTSTLASDIATPVEQQKNRSQTSSEEHASNTLRTSEYKKNGMPCIAELCIGDGIPELRKIKWDPAVNIGAWKGKPYYMNDSQRGKNVIQGGLKLAPPLHRGDLDSLTGYLYGREFDDLFLTQAHKVVATCRFDILESLVGTFTSKNGNPTKVQIRQLPVRNSTEKQEWVVEAITRGFSQVLSDQQVKETAIEMQRRYAGFEEIKNANYGEVGVSANGRGLRFALKAGLDVDERMRLHPACGGTKKVSVD